LTLNERPSRDVISPLFHLPLFIRREPFRGVFDEDQGPRFWDSALPSSHMTLTTDTGGIGYRGARVPCDVRAFPLSPRRSRFARSFYTCPPSASFFLRFQRWTPRPSADIFGLRIDWDSGGEALFLPPFFLCELGSGSAYPACPPPLPFSFPADVGMLVPDPVFYTNFFDA